MSNMREAFPEPGELLVIPVGRELPAVANQFRERDRGIRKKRNPAAGVLMAALAASLLLNAVQAVIIYVLQAGPIW